MPEHFSAGVYFGVLVDEDYLYEHYGDLGANLEQDSEWRQYEYPIEAFEAHVDRLSGGSNLHVVSVGHYEDESAPHLLALKEPHAETGYSDDYWAAPFDPATLHFLVGNPDMHSEAVRIAKALDLDWRHAGWQLCWSVG